MLFFYLANRQLYIKRHYSRPRVVPIYPVEVGEYVDYWWTVVDRPTEFEPETDIINALALDLVPSFVLLILAAGVAVGSKCRVFRVFNKCLRENCC